METVSRLSVLLNRLSERYSIFDTTVAVPETFQVEINDILFVFFYEESRREIYIQADVGEVVPGVTAEALRALLTMNYLWEATYGGVFGICRDSNVVTYHYRISDPLKKSEDYDEYLIDLVDDIAYCVCYARDILYSA
ncbi:CesT family type III secretion system chaperone [Salmonella enterica]|nr:CesT family type III secretion system chaperone [Salmonella enterica]